MTRCDDFRPLIDTWLDDEISDGGLASLTAHTETCDACRAAWTLARMMKQDMAMLNVAAERLIDAAVESKEHVSIKPTSTYAGRAWVWRIAAAIALASTIAIGYRFVQSNSPSPSHSLIAHAPQADPTIKPAVLTLADADAIVLRHPSHEMAVQFESSNSQVQIVWLYSPLPESGNDRATSAPGI